MIIYDLICDSRHEFEGWFNNSDDLASQQESAILRCPVCDSLAVDKKVAAPKLARKSNSTTVEKAQTHHSPTQVGNSVSNSNTGSLDAYNKMQGMLAKVHEFIDSNFEDVGNKFADEARSMHRGEKEASNIRGTASANDLKDLAKEGVAALPMPAKPVDKKKLN